MKVVLIILLTPFAIYVLSCIVMMLCGLIKREIRFTFYYWIDRFAIVEFNKEKVVFHFFKHS